MNDIFDLYIINNKKSWFFSSMKEDLIEFIKTYNLKEYLLKINKEIKKYFGEKDMYLLINYGKLGFSPAIYIKIKVDSKIAEALEKMNTFENEWLNKNKHQKVFVDIFNIY
ncbi:MAG: hypothetical protein ACOCP8_02490 [archaeon]